MTANLLNGRNFVDWTIAFTYRLGAPFAFGLIHTLLALGGLILVRFRSREWWFFGASGVVCCLLMTDAARPLWLAVPLAGIIQFPWRLFSLASVPMALLTAGSLRLLKPGLARGTAALLMLGLIIVANRPRVDWMPRMPDGDGTFSAATVAQYEKFTQALGLSANPQGTNSDFIPRWVDLSYGLSTTPSGQESLPTEGVMLELQAASAYEWQLSVASPQPVTLRFTSFYFPGWRAWLDGSAEINTHPTTALGLLTVDLPAGSHRLRVAWADTPVRWGPALSSHGWPWRRSADGPGGHPGCGAPPRCQQLA